MSAATGVTGPETDLSEELTGGAGVFLADPIPVDLGEHGYEQHEYLARGTATSYRAAEPLTADGRWLFAPAEGADYRTRVVVRRPVDRPTASGTVVVEWLNVSGGVDACPEWATLSEEIMRRGDTWVGVSAQVFGVMGGQVLVRSEAPGSELAGLGLRAIDPARYGSLDHPGDACSFDIFTQVGRALRSGATLDGRVPVRLVAAGESQSAFALVTYYNGVHPLTPVFDGFFVHSRGAAGLPLVELGEGADLAGSIAGVATIFRTDQPAPVMNVQTETDLTSILNSVAARQPDDDRFRLWEVAGTAHADRHLLGAGAQHVDCGVPINDGPLYLVAQAAYRSLSLWLESGRTPPRAARIEVQQGSPPVIRRDADGIAVGGIRTPPVDVAVEQLSGEPGPNPSMICLLLGSTPPFSSAQLERYPSRDVYLGRYATEADRVIEAGFVLPEDRDALLDFARPSRISE